MAQKKGRLSVTHRYGEDNADGTKEVIALTLIHIVRSKAFVIVLVGLLAGLGFIPIDFLTNALNNQNVIGIDNPYLPGASFESEGE